MATKTLILPGTRPAGLAALRCEWLFYSLARQWREAKSSPHSFILSQFFFPHKLLTISRKGRAALLSRKDRLSLAEGMPGAVATLYRSLLPAAPGPPSPSRRRSLRADRPRGPQRVLVVVTEVQGQGWEG